MTTTTSALAPAPPDSPWQTMPILGVLDMPLQPNVRPPGWAQVPTQEQLDWSVAWMRINRPGDAPPIDPEEPPVEPPEPLEPDNPDSVVGLFTLVDPSPSFGCSVADEQWYTWLRVGMHVQFINVLAQSPGTAAWLENRILQITQKPDASIRQIAFFDFGAIGLDWTNTTARIQKPDSGIV